MTQSLTLIRQFPVGPGGAERYLELLARGLVEKGFRITLLCADAPPHSFFVESAKVDLVRLDVPRLSVGRVLRPWYFPMAVQRWLKRYPQPFVFSLERHWRQDLLRAGDGVHVEWLERRERLHGLWMKAMHRASPYQNLMRWSERRAYHPERTLRVMANSQFVKRQIVARFGFPEGRIDVVYNGVDLRQWPAEPDPHIRTRLGIREDALVAVFVGTGWERKGLRRAVEAVGAWRAKSGRPAHLLVAGKGPRHRYRAEGVEFLGTCGSVDLARVYRGADVMILPTLYDPFANVTLEALASGVPVVTSASNGASEILTAGRDGTVLEAEAPAERWAEALDEWAEPGSRNGIRTACRAAAERHSLETHLADVLALCVRIAALKG